MAVRYSGRVVMHLVYVDGMYVAALRAPGMRGRGSTTISRVGSPKSSESYDRAATRLFSEAAAKGFPVERGRWGRIVVERVFKAPCPFEDV